MAYYVLNEKLNSFKIFQLIFAFGGASLMIFFTPRPELNSSNAGKDTDKLWIAIKYTCLVLNPILVAYGSVMMRQMRKLNENVVSCYMNGVAIPVMISLCYATGGDLSAWRDYDALEWICIVALSITVIAS